MAERKRKPAAGNGGAGGLTGGGPSLLGVSGAMRARDVSRVRDADVARAEKTVVIRRREWEPPPRTP